MNPNIWQPGIEELDRYCNKFTDSMLALDPATLPEEKILCGIFTDGLQPKFIKNHIKILSPKTVKECAKRARKKCLDFITAEATYNCYNRNFSNKNGHKCSIY